MTNPAVGSWRICAVARAVCLSIVLIGGMAQLMAQPATAEPSNAAELAAKKAAEDRHIKEQYNSKVAALSPERRAWEGMLQANLGESFYLPAHRRDFIKGVSTAWDFVVDDPKLPRVLLIGDSVSRGYTLAVRAALAGKANLHRAPENCGPTANGVKKLDVWLGDGRWDVIHFNFGIHDRTTSPTDYEARLEQIVQRLLQTGAKLIWASSTPLPDATKSTYGSDEAIILRNKIAAGVMNRHHIPIDDLYASVKPHLTEYQRPNDVHFIDAGYAFLGQAVAAEIEKAFLAK